MPKEILNESVYPSLNGKSNGNGNGLYSYPLPVFEPSLNVEEEEDSLDLKQLITVFKHRFRLICLVTAGITVASILWTLNQKPIYEGSFKLLVEPVSKSKDKSPLSLLGQDAGNLDYDSQVEVLTSPNTLEPIISKLSSDYPEMEYEDLIKKRSSPLVVEQIDDTKIIKVSFVDSDRQKIDSVLAALLKNYLSYSLDEKRAEVNQGIEFIGRELPTVRARVNSLQKELEKFRQDYNLINPEKQAVLLSEKQVSLEEKFLEAQSELNEAKSLSSTLEKQLGRKPQESIESSYLSVSTRYQELLTELQALEVRFAQESVRFSAQNPVIIGLEEERASLLNLLEQESIRVLGSSYSPNLKVTASTPTPSALQTELDLQYIQAVNAIQTLTIRKKALSKNIAEVNKSIEEMPVTTRKYNDLRRKLLVANESLNRFLAAQEELQLEAARQALPWQLIANPRQKEKAIAPVIPRNIALGLLGGLALGVGTALLLERLDPVFHSSEEIKENINVPLLGVIPIQKDLTPLNQAAKQKSLEESKPSSLPQLQIGGRVLELGEGQDQKEIDAPHKEKKHQQHRYDASPFTESFRSLNTNIRLLGSDSPINSIVISSSIPSEGKSTVSSNLAQAAAAMGQRVLLIDADLRRPQVHHWAGLENNLGLSNILAAPIQGNSEEDGLRQLIAEATQHPQDLDNFSVITAGDIPPDPTRLLSSQRMQKLMNLLKTSSQYDLIIYDTPPILGFADGRILANRTSGVVLVVRIAKTDRSLLKQNLDSLRMANIPVLGVIANYANRNGDSHHYYNNYYAERA